MSLNSQKSLLAVRSLAVAVAFISGLAAIAAIIFIAPNAITGDSLSYRALPATAGEMSKSRRTLERTKLYRDEECRPSNQEILSTEIDLSTVPPKTCDGRTKELVYIGSLRAMVACLSQKAEWATRMSIGSNGIGKTKQGDRKTPLGTYWLGYPRKSSYFGIFIPVGYPNAAEIAKGYTGQSIGIHGPMRHNGCDIDESLRRHWTAGCLSVARDTQIVNVSNWVLNNWPVKLTVVRDPSAL